jgi:hypothetical protein
VVDPSAASFIAQLRRDGLTPVPGDNAVLDGIREVSSLLASNRLRVHRSCVGLIEEIPGYVWDEKAVGQGRDEPLKINDHGCDGTRYLTFTTRRIWRPELNLPLAA